MIALTPRIASGLKYEDNDDPWTYEIIIPEIFTEIDPEAFYYNNTITSVNIPDTVTKIGASAFEGAYELENIKLGSNITNIGPRAFYWTYDGATKADFVLPQNLEEIGDCAFERSNLSGSIEIPAGVSKIGDSVFYNNSIDSVVLPYGVVEIGSYAFADNVLTSVVIPDSVTSIEDYAFYKNNLTSVVIPDSVTKIGEGAFIGNDIYLTEIELPAFFRENPPYDAFDDAVLFTFSGEEDTTPNPTPAPVPTPTPTPTPVPTPAPEPTLTGNPPNLIKATLRGKDITLQFDNVLADTQPSISRFTLNQSNREYLIVNTKIRASDGVVTLTAEKELDPTVRMTLDYLDFSGDQKTGVIESPTGVDLTSFTGFALNNQGSQKSYLTIDEGEFEGNQITLFLTTPISDAKPSKRQFSVKSANKRQKILDISTEPDDGIIVLTTKKNLDLQESVFISYRDLGGDQVKKVVEDLAGNDMETIKDFEIISGGNDSIAPTVSSATLDENTLTVEFDSIIRNTKISPKRFKVNVNGKKVRIKSATIEKDDSYLYLQLQPKNLRTLDINSSVTLDYKDPKGDQTSKVIEDMFGNDLDSFRWLGVEIVKI